MKIYLFMCLNDVVGDTYYTDKKEVEKLVEEAGGGDFWCKEISENTDNINEPNPAKYLVFFYFRWSSTRFMKPDKIVEVRTFDDRTEFEIVARALKDVGAIPRTYSTHIVRVE